MKNRLAFRPVWGSRLAGKSRKIKERSKAQASLYATEKSGSIYFISKTDLCPTSPLRSCFPLDWARNFHLAFRTCKGKVLTEEQNGVWIQIEDAENCRFPLSLLTAPIRIAARLCITLVGTGSSLIGSDRTC